MVKVTVHVVAEDIPHLLSIGLLESAGSVINTQTNQIQFENIGTEDKMVRLRSGHRVVDISKWDGQPFPVPQEVQDKYGISDGAFNLKDSRSRGAYMSGPGSSTGEEDWWNVPGTTLLVKIHQEARKKLYNPMHEKCAESWHEQLGERRVTICQQATGEVSCFADEWRKKEGVSLEQEWHGITIFTKNHAHGELCPSLQCFSSSSLRNSRDCDQHSSFCLLHGGAEDSSFMSQCFGGGTEGELRRLQCARRGARRTTRRKRAATIQRPALSTGPTNTAGGNGVFAVKRRYHTPLTRPSRRRIRRRSRQRWCTCRRRSRRSCMEDAHSKSGYHQGKKEAPSASTDPRVLQETLIESNHQLLSGMTSLLGQALAPVVQGQQALMEMSQQAMMGQGAMAMQTGQAELTQAVLHLAKTPRETPETD